MVVGAQREPSHLCSQRQDPSPSHHVYPLPPPSCLALLLLGPLCAPPLWSCRGCSSLLRVPDLTSTPRFSRGCPGPPQDFSTGKVRPSPQGCSLGFLTGSCSVSTPLFRSMRRESGDLEQGFSHVKVQSNADWNLVGVGWAWECAFLMHLLPPTPLLATL